MTRPVPPGNSPLAALLSGEPIKDLESKRNRLQALLNDLEDATTERELQDERVAARRRRRAEALGTNRKGEGEVIRPDHGRNVHLAEHDPHGTEPTETWKG